MSGFYSTYTCNNLEGLIFGAAAYSPPATLYLALSTTTPAADGSGFTEPAVGSYARAAVTNNTTNFPAPTVGVVQNAILVAFPTATAGWSTITWAGWYDAATSGNLLCAGPLTVSKTILTGDTLQLPINSFTGTQT